MHGPFERVFSHHRTSVQHAPACDSRRCSSALRRAKWHTAPHTKHAPPKPCKLIWGDGTLLSVFDIDTRTPWLGTGVARTGCASPARLISGDGTLRFASNIHIQTPSVGAGSTGAGCAAPSQPFRGDGTLMVASDVCIRTGSAQVRAVLGQGALPSHR